jgi:hypothetical protein
MADQLGQVTALTTIADIIPERLETLKQVLEAVQQNPSLALAKISTIHYARWVIIDEGRRLLFTSNFDGTFEDYIQDFVREIPDGLDRIWGHCVGYPGSRPIEGFFDYINARRYPAACFYAAYPDSTVPEVRNALKWKAAGEKLVPALQEFLIEVSDAS